MITPPDEHDRRQQLYDAKLTDQEMAEACFICINAIRYWRESRVPKLPPNSKKCERLEIRMHLYNNGLTDIEIARHQRCSRMAIRDWRAKRGLLQNKCNTMKAKEENINECYST
jgi:hypothetical protein